MIPLQPPRRLIDVEIDGETVRVPEGSTILDACQAAQLTEQVLMLKTQLAPRGGRPLGTAVLAEVDEPAAGRR